MFAFVCPKQQKKEKRNSCLVPSNSLVGDTYHIFTPFFLDCNMSATPQTIINNRPPMRNRFKKIPLNTNPKSPVFNKTHKTVYNQRYYPQKHTDHPSANITK